MSVDFPSSTEPQVRSRRSSILRRRCVMGAGWVVCAVVILEVALFFAVFHCGFGELVV